MLQLTSGKAVATQECAQIAVDTHETFAGCQREVSTRCRGRLRCSCVGDVTNILKVVDFSAAVQIIK